MHSPTSIAIRQTPCREGPARPSPDRREVNLRGWESVAAGWRNVSWPRRPTWSGEFQKLEPLLSSFHREEALVLGATPEFRAWLNRNGARVSLYEKSDISLAAMTTVLRTQFGISRPNEIVIPHDWESPDYEKNRYSLIMGDLVAGYLETKERFMEFMVKLNRMLADHGFVVLREFVNIPYIGRIPHAGADARRWAHILKPGFAIEGDRFYEDKLMHNLARMCEWDVLNTCADPPRTRLMLKYEDFPRIFQAAGFMEVRVSPPVYDEGPKPALWALQKESGL